MSYEQVIDIFKDTFVIKYNSIQYQSEMQGKILTNLFYEPSTRTSSSFHAAMIRLGGNVIPINDVNYSSVSKGENLQDTIITMGNYSDVIVLRSQHSGDAQKAAEVSSVPIINAGDGNGEHPTQTLIDLYTIKEQFGRLKNLKITFVGDVENSRTVHSLAHFLKNWNDISYKSTYNTDFIPQSDVYYFTRVQRERGSNGSYEMTREMTKQMPDDCIVMHPFPRNEEIPRWFDTDKRSKYFQQMENGLYVRMALLMHYR